MARNQRQKKSNDSKKAKSGAKLWRTVDMENSYKATAWKIIEGQFTRFSFFVSKKQYDKGIVVSGKNDNPKFTGVPKRWIGVTMRMSKPGHADVYQNCLLNCDNDKVYIKDWGWVMNPHAKNGGYIGTQQYSEKDD